MIGNKYDDAIEYIVQKYKSVLHEDEYTTNCELEESEDENTYAIGVHSLSELSFVKMDQLKVSCISLFKDDLWDWREEGSPLYKEGCFFHGTKRYQ